MNTLNPAQVQCAPKITFKGRPVVDGHLQFTPEELAYMAEEAAKARVAAQRYRRERAFRDRMRSALGLNIIPYFLDYLADRITLAGLWLVDVFGRGHNSVDLSVGERAGTL